MAWSLQSASGRAKELKQKSPGETNLPGSVRLQSAMAFYLTEMM